MRLTKLNCLPRISARGRQCIMHRWITKKITCAITGTRDLWTAENRECFVKDLVYIKFNVFQKINKIFHVFSYEFRFIFSFLWLLVYNKYLLAETSGKQYVCGPSTVDVSLGFNSGNIDSLGKHRQSRVHKTYCFPRSQSISMISAYYSRQNFSWKKPDNELL